MDTDDKSEDYVVNKDDYELVYFQDSNANSLMFIVSNKTDSAKTIKECKVSGIYVDEYEVEDGNQGVVVACDEKSKILTSSDFYTYDYSSYEQIDTTEQTLTSAILNIITDEKPQVYFLTGHSEAISKLSTFNVFLQNEINDVNTLDLITSEFPEKCDCLILTTPTSDYSELEKNKIVNLAHLNSGFFVYFNVCIEICQIS